jgi:hypothetical protein
MSIPTAARSIKPSRPASSRRQRRRPLALVEAAPPTAPSRPASAPPASAPPPAPAALSAGELWAHVASQLLTLSLFVQRHRAIAASAVVAVMLETLAELLTRWAANGADESGLQVECDDNCNSVRLALADDAEPEHSDEPNPDDDDEEGLAIGSRARGELAMYLTSALTDVELVTGSVHLARRSIHCAVSALSGHRPNVKDALQALKGASVEGGEALEQLWLLGGELSSIGTLITGVPGSAGTPRLCAALARVEAGERALPRGTGGTDNARGTAPAIACAAAL